jgi:Na+/glutamate symporter
MRSFLAKTLQCALKLLKPLVAAVPIVRAITYATRKEHQDALREFVLIWGSSLLPIIACVAIDYFTHYSVENNLVTNATPIEGLMLRIYSNINSGELFIYVCALIGPVILMLSRYNDERRRFPEYMTFHLAIVVLLMVSCTVYSLSRTEKLKNIALADATALVVYLVGLAIWYSAMIYDRVRPNYAAALDNDANELQRALEGEGRK